jgi:hypothetical protein
MSRIPTASEARERVAFLIARARVAGIRRWAVVVAGTTHYGMGRMAQFLSEPASHVVLRVFRDPSEAQEWACRAETNGAA